MNARHAGAAGIVECLYGTIRTWLPDDTALAIVAVHEFPVLGVQTPDAIAANAPQRHPVAVIPRAVVRNRVDELVGAILGSLSVLSVLNEEWRAESPPWKHRAVQLGRRAPRPTVVCGLDDRRVPSLLDPGMVVGVEVTAHGKIKHPFHRGQPAGFPHGTVFPADFSPAAKCLHGIDGDAMNLRRHVSNNPAYGQITAAGLVKALSVVRSRVEVAVIRPSRGPQITVAPGITSRIPNFGPKGGCAVSGPCCGRGPTRLQPGQALYGRQCCQSQNIPTCGPMTIHNCN